MLFLVISSEVGSASLSPGRCFSIFYVQRSDLRSRVGMRRVPANEFDQSKAVQF